MQDLAPENSEKVLTTGFLFYLNLIRAIQKSKVRIACSMYIFEDDRTGRYVLAKLIQAAKRGVSVKLILDGVGSLNSYIVMSQKVEHLANFEVSLHNPLPWPFSKINIEKHIQNRVFFSLLKTVNQRNHTKFFVFDDDTVFIGSHNIFNSSLLWRETSVRIVDEEVSKSCHNIVSWLDCRSFRMKRAMEKRKVPIDGVSDKLYFLRSLRSRRLFMAEIDRRLVEAKESIQIINPYFFPPMSLVRSLAAAGKRGVKVEIILPSQSDTFLFPMLSRLLYPKLLRSCVAIFEYPDTLPHAKQCRIDRWNVVGSSNLNSRSLFRDLELNYSLQSANERDDINQRFEVDKSNSKSIGQWGYRPFSRFIRWCFAKIVGSWV